MDSFIIKSQEIHGAKYDYSRVNYINYTTTVDILCKKCNIIFKQKPGSHLRGAGCKTCGVI